MIADLKPYPEYKDSGLPWLGRVPGHWDMRKPRQIGRLLKGAGGTKEDALPAGVPCVRYGELYTTHTHFVRTPKTFICPDRATDYTLLQYGDVLFAASGETLEDIGKSAVNLIEGMAVCGGDVIILRPTVSVHAPFLGYVMNCRPSVNQKATMGRGTTVKHIYPDELKQLLFPLPPVAEQAAIVRFLDWANGRLERAIRAKRKVIALLGEQKQAIIHRAVTRGLDPFAPLKPSGILSLGDIPQSWEVWPFVRCTLERADYRGATPDKVDSGIFLVTAKNIRKGWIDYECSKEFVRTAEYSKIMRRGLPKIGDVPLTMEAPLGHIALVDREDIAIAQRVIRFRLRDEQVHPRFALLALNDSYFQHQLHERATGSTAQGMKASKLSQLLIACPPLTEQDQIIERIDVESAPIETATSRLEREIELLREYRTRLVADVVTGKLDVREAALRLPIESPLDIAEDDTDLTDELEAADEEAAA